MEDSKFHVNCGANFLNTLNIYLASPLTFGPLAPGKPRLPGVPGRPWGEKISRINYIEWNFISETRDNAASIDLLC